MWFVVASSSFDGLCRRLKGVKQFEAGCAGHGKSFSASRSRSIARLIRLQIVRRSTAAEGDIGCSHR
jgi:hypothetical protein